MVEGLIFQVCTKICCLSRGWRDCK